VPRKLPPKLQEQFHSALAYYRDHKEDFDRDIERRLEGVERMRREVGLSRLTARLRAEGLPGSFGAVKV
jgi:ribosomal protein L18E